MKTIKISGQEFLLLAVVVTVLSPFLISSNTALADVFTVQSDHSTNLNGAITANDYTSTATSTYNQIRYYGTGTDISKIFTTQFADSTGNNHQIQSYDVFWGTTNHGSINDGLVTNCLYDINTYPGTSASSVTINNGDTIHSYSNNYTTGYYTGGSYGDASGHLAFSLAYNSAGCDKALPLSFYYGQIKNTSSGYAYLYSTTTGDTSYRIKRLPQDWIVHVGTTTNGSGTINAGGYHWFQVTDPTDNVTGWMQGEDASSTTQYLPYNSSQQTAFQATSSDYIATSSRPDLILAIIDGYFNGSSTAYSLYSSNDGSNHISDLRDGGFVKKVIWGMAAYESGPNFDNQNVSYDYGHGIMQLTFNAWSHEPSDPHSTYDNRGVGSKLTIYPCASIYTSDYTNCYSNAGTADTNPKHYIAYGGNTSNPTYKAYTNTAQSIYANIKDGMEVLAGKFNLNSSISTSTTINGTTYTATDRKTILATENYNGACGYVDIVADKLDAIDSYFPNATSSDISDLIQKMHTAGGDMICAQLHSPAEVSVQDSTGKVVGVENGKGRNDFPLAVYDKEQKFVKILSPDYGNYTFKVVGTGNGKYGFDVTFKTGNQYITYKTKDIPVDTGQINTYIFDKDALLKGKDGVTVQVDLKGNGHVDTTYTTGSKNTTVTYKTKVVPPKPQKSVLNTQKSNSNEIFREQILEQAPKINNNNNNNPLNGWPYAESGTVYSVASTTKNN
jgi:hypothetical protein